MAKQLASPVAARPLAMRSCNPVWQSKSARRAPATGHAGDEKVASVYSLELAGTQLQHDKPSMKKAAQGLLGLDRDVRITPDR
jgi:hypothetical protein